MIPNKNGYQAYQKNKYETASPHKLILLLYEAAIRNGARAVEALQSNRPTEANNAIIKLQDIIYELIASLNEKQGGEIAANLKSLYMYMIDQAVQANIKKDTAPLEEVIVLIRDIKTAWEQIGKDVSLGKINQ